MRKYLCKDARNFTMGVDLNELRINYPLSSFFNLLKKYFNKSSRIFKHFWCNHETNKFAKQENPESPPLKFNKTRFSPLQKCVTIQFSPFAIFSGLVLNFYLIANVCNSLCRSGRRFYDFYWDGISKWKISDCQFHAVLEMIFNDCIKTVWKWTTGLGDKNDAN